MNLAALAFQLVLTSPVVVDGDTLRWRGEDYRLAGVDAPEISQPGCDAEAAHGRRAADRMAALLAGAARIEAAPAHDPRGRKRWPVDGFGRRIATVTVDGRDVGALLVAEGLAAPYREGEVRNWCARLEGRLPGHG